MGRESESTPVAISVEYLESPKVTMSKGMTRGISRNKTGKHTIKVEGSNLDKLPSFGNDENSEQVHPRRKSEAPSMF